MGWVDVVAAMWPRDVVFSRAVMTCCQHAIAVLRCLRVGVCRRLLLVSCCLFTQDGKTYPLCPLCYNYPPFEGVTKVGVVCCRTQLTCSVGSWPPLAASVCS